ncbi:hypothetical protein, partial [Streptomyces jumonjinensis]|uniref:hypothetical protein n=1 Tax=Streptomyces jumonjinensis TaxID=1945 RepID=UPI001E3ADF5C
MITATVSPASSVSDSDSALWAEGPCLLGVEGRDITGFLTPGEVFPGLGHIECDRVQLPGRVCGRKGVHRSPADMAVELCGIHARDRRRAMRAACP